MKPLSKFNNSRPYYRSNGVEAIDIIRTHKLGFSLGNVLKYILRAGRKCNTGQTLLQTAVGDLEKAKAYLEFELTETYYDMWTEHLKASEFKPTNFNSYEDFSKLDDCIRAYKGSFSFKVTDFKGFYIGLIDILKEIKFKVKQLTPEKEEQILKDIFGLYYAEVNCILEKL